MDNPDKTKGAVKNSPDTQTCYQHCTNLSTTTTTNLKQDMTSNYLAKKSRLCNFRVFPKIWSNRDN